MITISPLDLPAASRQSLGGAMDGQSNKLSPNEVTVTPCPSCGQRLRLPIGKLLEVTCTRCHTDFRFGLSWDGHRLDEVVPHEKVDIPATASIERRRPDNTPFKRILVREAIKTWTLFAVAALIGLLLIAVHTQREPGRDPPSASHASQQTHTGTPAVSAGWAQSTGGYRSAIPSDAAADFSEAAERLQQSVRGLSYAPWPEQMDEIQRRFGDAESALANLEVAPGGANRAAQARHELEQMRRHLSRLQFENWRDVAPDLTRASSNIHDAASSLPEEAEVSED